MNAKMMLGGALVLAIMGWHGQLFAGYNANFMANVTWVATYRGGNVCVGFSNKPSGCSGTYLCTAGDSDSSTNRIYSRLLAAYKTGEQVNLGYDTAACAAGGPIYRAG